VRGPPFARTFRWLATSLLVVSLTGCSPADPPTDPPTGPPTGRPTGPPDPPAASPAAPSTPGPAPAVRRHGPISVPALAEARIRGGGLRIGRVREQTTDYTSYDVTFRSRLTDDRALSGPQSLTISGVLNVPTGEGPFPAVVLAHGYIPPEVYATGQGMTRERGVLATAGYVTLHVDYRNHAASDDDPDLARDLRLGYVVDTVAAGRALQATRDVPVDDERLALLGRSMGGGVGMKALIVEPDLFSAASLWGSVSSLEAEVFRHFLAVDALSPDNPARFHGRPAEAPRFWRGVSARPFFGEVTASVELVHGQVDEVCPPRWAPATLRAMRRAGVDAHLSWYPDRHAFGPSFTEAMRTTVDFIDRELGVDR
jgi:dipeptidyl aminopeptidase/acylaminoacyl peptidase